MNSFKILNFALFFSSMLLLTPMAIAAPAQNSSVDKLLKLSEIDVFIQDTLQALHPHFEAESENIILSMTGSDQLDAEQLIVSQEIAQLLFDTTEQIMTQPQVKLKIKEMMQTLYTEEEVQAYINFLSTPEGQSINRKETQMANEMQLYFRELAQNSFQNAQFEQKLEDVMTQLMHDPQN